MELIVGVVTLGVGIAIGIYIASQISEHVDSRTQNRDLLENMKKRDSAKNEGLWKDCGSRR